MGKPMQLPYQYFVHFQIHSMEHIDSNRYCEHKAINNNQLKNKLQDYHFHLNQQYSTNFIKAI